MFTFPIRQLLIYVSLKIIIWVCLQPTVHTWVDVHFRNLSPHPRAPLFTDYSLWVFGIRISINSSLPSCRRRSFLLANDPQIRLEWTPATLAKPNPNSSRDLLGNLFYTIPVSAVQPTSRRHLNTAPELNHTRLRGTRSSINCGTMGKLIFILSPAPLPICCI